MNKNPLVSVIIPVYNKQKKNDYLKEAIDSALNQDYKNIEIIVVNDGSNDNDVSKNIALSYKDKIKYIEKENGGVSTALNLAIKEMKGEYFSWLSHDDVYFPNKISSQINYLNKHDLFGDDIILYSDYELIDKNSKHISNAIKNTEELNQKTEYALLRGAINGLTLLIPKKAFEEFGDFDVNLRAIQDYELWYRFAKKYKYVHVPEILVKSRYHATQVSNTSPKVLSEGNPFWLQMITNLTKKDMERLEGSEYSFYEEMILFLKQTPYNVPLEYCEQKQLEILEAARKELKKYTVEVIIPFHNREEVTLRAIKSVENQTFHNIKLILVNDGSTEDISKIKKYIKNKKNITLIDLKKNVGAAEARNIGMNNVTADYMAFLDSDDEYLPTKIEEQLLTMVVSKGNFSHTSYIRKLNNTEKIIESGNDKGFRNKKLIYSCPIATPTVMFNTKFINKNNYRFDSNLIIGEDTCFWLTILKEERLIGINKPLTIVNAGDGSAAYNLDKQILGMKTILKFLLNDEYYNKFDLEVSFIATAYSNVVRPNNSDYCYDQFSGNFVKRNTKKVVYYIKTEGLKNTAKRFSAKIKRKLYEK